MAILFVNQFGEDGASPWVTVLFSLILFGSHMGLLLRFGPALGDRRHLHPEPPPGMSPVD
ncbi:MAG TPA: hypothetical protein VLL75_11700 [Vicinamibacteria bacterium]|nr:hypothetical protein [Vicinamibacteria bacterium]